MKKILTFVGGAKMKKGLTILALLLMLCAACLMVACGKDSGGGGGGGGGDDPIPAKYTITFLNHDETELEVILVEEGEVPQYPNANPQKQADEDFSYNFSGWIPQIVAATKDASYTAQFEPIPIEVIEPKEGAKENPYTIKTKADLELFATQVNGGEKFTDTYFILTNDIDLEDAEWTPIGTSNLICFEGTFDGNGFSVKSFKITSVIEYAGLFGYNSGTIKNLRVTDFKIDSSYSSYAEAYAGGLVGRNYGAITNCCATGDVGVASYVAYAGGLVGGNYGTITSCYATGNVGVTTSSSAATYAGGLVGLNYKGTITDCYAIGNVSVITASSDTYAGGLVGLNYGTIINCYAMGDANVTSSSAAAYAGGLVGGNANRGTITNCYATGCVNVTSTPVYVCAGGLVGCNTNYGAITNCYATGDVDAVSSANSCTVYVGGLVGYNYNGTITNCYRYKNQVFYRKINANEYNVATNNEGSPCTLAELNSQSFYIDALKWDADIWDFSDLDFEGGKFPTLKEINGSAQKEG